MQVKAKYTIRYNKEIIIPGTVFKVTEQEGKRYLDSGIVLPVKKSKVNSNSDLV